MNATTENIVANSNPAENHKTVADPICYTDFAISKLEEEIKSFKGGRMETVIYKEVGDTLIKFCKQSSSFAEVVAKTPRTLSDCCAKVVEGVDGNGISDIKAYRKAIQFYFPNSDVMFHMQIRHTGTAPSEEEIKRPAERPVPPPKPAQRAAIANETAQNIDTNTIHLDLFADDEEVQK